MISEGKMYNSVWAEDFLSQYEGNRVTQMTYKTPLGKVLKIALGLLFVKK